ncbi:hypothetical protein [Yersinia phage vB_YenM_P778]
MARTGCHFQCTLKDEYHKRRKKAPVKGLNSSMNKIN